MGITWHCTDTNIENKSMKKHKIKYINLKQSSKQKKTQRQTPNELPTMVQCTVCR